MRLCLLLLSVFFTFQARASSYQPGYYYGPDGGKKVGLIKFYPATFSVFGSSPSLIKFKSSQEAKEERFTAKEISSFVIGQDSFTVATNFKINAIKGYYKRDFVRVLKTGSLCLYQHFSASSDGKFNYQNDRYVLAKAGENTFLGLYDLSHQKAELRKYLQSEPKVSVVPVQKLKYDQIPSFVDECNRSASSISK